MRTCGATTDPGSTLKAKRLIDGHTQTVTLLSRGGEVARTGACECSWQYLATLPNSASTPFPWLATCEARHAGR
jgi:hypothetical protein